MGYHSALYKGPHWTTLYPIPMEQNTPDSHKLYRHRHQEMLLVGNLRFCICTFYWNQQHRQNYWHHKTPKPKVNLRWWRAWRRGCRTCARAPCTARRAHPCTAGGPDKIFLFFVFILYRPMIYIPNIKCWNVFYDIHLNTNQPCPRLLAMVHPPTDKKLNQKLNGLIL